MRLANYFSRKSRTFASGKPEEFLGENNEWLLIFSKEVLQKEFYDYFIFGHRHLPMDLIINEKLHQPGRMDKLTAMGYLTG
jgi:UDP-2,3-diacylglucosamine hydrolase